jgi:hypothetical protein
MGVQGSGRGGPEGCARCPGLPSSSHHSAVVIATIPHMRERKQHANQSLACMPVSSIGDPVPRKKSPSPITFSPLFGLMGKRIMKKSGYSIVLAESTIINRIYIIRGKRVMIDRDLAELYQVQTRSLNQGVRRNIDRFPIDFMFQLTNQEFKNWKSQIVISKNDRMSLRKNPLAFTEQGVAMLSGILNSKQAISVNIAIMRVFVQLRRSLEANKEIGRKLEELEKTVAGHDEKIKLIFQVIKQLIEKKEEPPAPRNPIGYR